MTEPLLAVERLVKRYGGLTATDDLSLRVEAHELHAVIGPNGAGKSTLVAQLAGEIKPDGGTIRFAGRDITKMPASGRAALGLGRSFQITSVFPDFSVMANVGLAVQAHAGRSFRFLKQVARSPEISGPAEAILERVGLHSRAHDMVRNLSHGEKRALEVAMALAGRPRLLLLDEPMAGMGPQESAAMIALLRQLKGSVGILLIEHDMDAVFALADRITVLVYGRVVAQGDAHTIRNHPQVRDAYLGADDD